MLLSLATALAWFGWSAVAAEAQAPDACQLEGNCALPDQCQYPTEESCPGPDCGCVTPCECGPRWTFAAEAIALQRTNTRSQTLFSSGGSTEPAQLLDGTTELLNARNLNFPVAFGYQFSAIRHDVLGCGWDVEVGVLSG